MNNCRTQMDKWLAEPEHHYTLEGLLATVFARIERNRSVYGPYANLHTVLGVLHEEYDEVKHEIVTHHREPEKLRSELIDLAAACLDAASQLPQIYVRADRLTDVDREL